MEGIPNESQTKYIKFDSPPFPPLRPLPPNSTKATAFTTVRLQVRARCKRELARAAAATRLRSRCRGKNDKRQVTRLQRSPTGTKTNGGVQTPPSKTRPKKKLLSRFRPAARALHVLLLCLRPRWLSFFGCVCLRSCVSSALSTRRLPILLHRCPSERGRWHGSSTRRLSCYGSSASETSTCRVYSCLNRPSP